MRGKDTLAIKGDAASQGRGQEDDAEGRLAKGSERKQEKSDSAVSERQFNRIIQS